MNPVVDALAGGRPSLTEHEAKQFLAGFGIPISRYATAADAEAAVAEAKTIGFPVVLKASGAELQHKTEAGGVVLDLRSEAEVREAAQRLLQIPGCAALLVEEMVRGDRELVCGIIREVQLGPCVMFGLGGILTEVLDDAVYRVAPLTDADALGMLQDIRSAKILGPFRGQPPADRAALSKILVALGNIAIEHEAIREIDLNPIKIRPDGSPVAVDALIALTINGAIQP